MHGSAKDPVVEKPTSVLRLYYEGERKREEKGNSVASLAPGRYEAKTSIEARNDVDGCNEMKVRKDPTKEARRKQETICASHPPRGHVPEGGTESLKSSATLQMAHGDNPVQGRKVKELQTKNAAVRNRRTKRRLL